MLRELTAIDEQMIDFAWELGKRAETASYPRPSSRAQLLERLQKAVHPDQEGALGYYAGGLLQGICTYFWDPQERYAQTTLFLLERSGYPQAADEFTAFLRDRLGGYELLVGVSAANDAAVSYLQDRGFVCVEASIDTRLARWRRQTVDQAIVVEAIGPASFGEYVAFHDQHALPLEMYWHSKNIQRELERFRILAVRQGGEIRASIFARTYPEGAEIIGHFAPDGAYAVREALLQSLLELLHRGARPPEEVVYFIDEGSDLELQAALNAGFEINDHYRCYRCIL